MKIGVLGANGFVGSRMVERWYSAGDHCVVPVVRGFTSLARLSRLDIECKIGDTLDEESLKRAFEGCEVVIQCVQGSPEVIEEGAATAYRAADAAGVRRLIFMSSASVHGQKPAEGTDETSTLSDKQWHWYNNAKVRAEWRLLDARKKGKTEVVILRPAIITGPRSNWVAEFAQALMAGRAYVIDGGMAVLNSIFVDNLIHGVELAAGAKGADREAFLIQDAEPVCWRDLFEPICRALGHSWSDVHDLPSSEVIIERRHDRVQALKDNKVLKGVLPHLPSKLKRSGRAVIQAWPKPMIESGYDLPAPSGPLPSEDMLLLQTGSWRLPDDKAKRLLRYQAETSFAEGIQMTLDWMRFAGYPIRTNV